MVVLTAASQFTVSNRMERLKKQMVSVQNTPENDPLRVEFNRLHHISVGYEGAVLLLGFAGMFCSSGKWSRNPNCFISVCASDGHDSLLPRGLRGRILLVKAYPAFSKARHMYQLATVRYGRQRSPNFSNSLGVGMCFFPYATDHPFFTPRS